MDKVDKPKATFPLSFFKSLGNKIYTSFKIYGLPVYDIKYSKVSKGAKIRNRYNQVPHLTQDTNGKVTNSQIDTTNESQWVNPFPANDHKAHINRRAQTYSKVPPAMFTADVFSQLMY